MKNQKFTPNGLVWLVFFFMFFSKWIINNKINTMKWYYFPTNWFSYLFYDFFYFLIFLKIWYVLNCKKFIHSVSESIRLLLPFATHVELKPLRIVCEIFLTALFIKFFFVWMTSLCNLQQLYTIVSVCIVKIK